MKTVIFEKGTVVIQKSLVVDGTTYYVGRDYEIPKIVRDEADLWCFDDTTIDRDIVHISNDFYICQDATLIVEGLADYMNTMLLGTHDLSSSELDTTDPERPFLRRVLARLYEKLWSSWFSVMLRYKPLNINMSDYLDMIEE